MSKGLWFVSCLLLGAAMAAFGAGEPEAVAASEMEEDYEPGQDYRWATPADYERATGKPVGQFKEAPILSERVAAGVLPPVAERLPMEPLVLGKQIGTYGGTLFMASPWRAKTYGAEPYSLFGLRIPAHGWVYDMYPNLAKSAATTEGGRIWTIKLREGTRWSDGEPFSADDIIFWWEDVYTMEEAPAFYTRAQQNSGVYKEVRKIDDYTVEFEFTTPTNVMFYVWAGKALAGFQKQYWKQFHPRYADEQTLDELVKEGGFENWLKLFAHMTDTDGRHNTERPILLPWVLVQGAGGSRRHGSGPPGDVIMKRNPYYWAVDPAGNQLPYIDELYRFGALDREVVHLKALAGELDIAMVDVDTYNLAKERESQGKIVAMNYKDTVFVAAGLMFNMNHQDPVLREIFSDKRFRFAASHAINREQINQLVYFGTSEPWQAAPWEDSSDYHERLAHTAIEYDPEKASSLLAEVGLKQAADGTWTRPDGKQLKINLVSYESRDNVRIAELIADDLNAVGLNVNLRVVTGSLAYQMIKGNELDAFIMGGPGMGQEGLIFAGPFAGAVVPADDFNSAWAPLWQQWYESHGEKGEEPIPEVKRAMELYRAILVDVDPHSRREKWMEIADIAADNLWSIGTVKWPGYYKIYSSRVRNWPREPLAWDRGGDKGRPELYFLKQ